MKTLMMFLAIPVGLSFVCSHSPTMEATTQPQVTVPPESLKLDPFYHNYVSSQGLPILASGKVPDAALLVADELINHMLADRPDVRKALVDSGVRFVVIGATEGVTEIPEYSHMKPKEFWDERSRGFGGRIVSCGEENLLCYPVDRYDDESILVHEFAHCIHGMGLRRIDKEFNKKLARLYDEALAKGLWKNTYAGSNPGEYWAEGVQSYFDANRQNNYNHNHVNTREELEAYDPALFQLIAETFRHSAKTDWRYTPVANRPRVTSPPKSLACDPFYKKYVYARGLPILSSENPSDSALLEANYLAREMFAYRHDILRDLIDAGLRIVVIGENERIADIPEYPEVNIDPDQGKPVRGLDYTPRCPLIGCGEENLLNYPSDRYAGESILIRELARAAHAICGLRPVDQSFENKPKQQYELRVKRLDNEFDNRLRQLYKKAREQGLYENTPAGRNHVDYWAEGVQSWFDCKQQAGGAEDETNSVNTREELEAYDPELAELIAEVLRHSYHVDWRYRRHVERQAQGSQGLGQP